MTSRERVLTALKLGKPDRVPWVESSVHNALAEKLLKRSDFEKATVTQLFSTPGSRIPPEVLKVIALDNLNFSIAPPRFVQSQPSHGMDMILDGLIKTEAEVRERIEKVGVGGGYILASSNGLTAYCKPENVLAMNCALLKYGYYSANSLLSFGPKSIITYSLT